MTTERKFGEPGGLSGYLEGIREQYARQQAKQYEKIYHPTPESLQSKGVIITEAEYREYMALEIVSHKGDEIKANMERLYFRPNDPRKEERSPNWGIPMVNQFIQRQETRLTKHLHTEMSELICLLEGKPIVVILTHPGGEREKFILAKGDGVVIPRNTPHDIINPNRDTCMIGAVGIIINEGGQTIEIED